MLTIRDMARQFGVSLRALRFYEDRGLLAPLRQGLARYYRASDRDRLERVLAGKAMGFTLTEIGALLAKRPPEGEAGPNGFGAVLAPEEIAAQIDHLQRQRDELDQAIHALRDTHARLAAY